MVTTLLRVSGYWSSNDWLQIKHYCRIYSMHIKPEKNCPLFRVVIYERAFPTTSHSPLHSTGYEGIEVAGKERRFIHVHQGYCIIFTDFNASRWHFRRRVVDHEPIPCWWQWVVTHQDLSRRSLQLQRVKPGAAVWAAEDAMSRWGALRSWKVRQDKDQRT